MLVVKSSTFMESEISLRGLPKARNYFCPKQQVLVPRHRNIISSGLI